MIVESVFCFAVCCQCLAFVLPLLKGSAIIYSDHGILAQMISVGFPFRLCDKLLWNLLYSVYIKSFVSLFIFLLQILSEIEHWRH